MTRLWHEASLGNVDKAVAVKPAEAFALPPADRVALHELGLSYCLNRKVLPLCRIGALRIVLADPSADTPATRSEMAEQLGPVSVIRRPGEEVVAAILAICRTEMVRSAETRVPKDLSCRSLPLDRATVPLALAALTLVCLELLFTAPLIAALMWLALGAATVNAALGLWALISDLFTRPPPPDDVALARWPEITLLVPVFRETAVLDHLLARLGRLDYPLERLDILLICEEDDHALRQALHTHILPDHIRIVPVPRGPVRTKPRAMNYALTFARGSIVGIYDAEDAPDPDQLKKVARQFANLTPDVACLQGILSIDNARDSWITRAFALDYAMWFRLILPALSRAGAVVPLGGTTVFFRRAALDHVGGWDAHNVTEDADLGVRLCRFGYRCGLIDSVTQEEAPLRIAPWVRQRARWLKGYALTWAVHMRRPAALWRDLGAWRFLWFHVLFLGALGGFALAPAIWLAWLHLNAETRALLPPAAPSGPALLAPLALSALVQIGLACRAAAKAGRLWLLPWIPALWPYFGLGTVALFRALFGVIVRPYWWDKTSHGVTQSRASAPDPAPEEAPL